MKISKVWGPDGYQVGPVNSMVGKGETIVNFDTGDSSLVTKGKVGQDTEYSSVTENDNNVILGNDPILPLYNRGKSGITFAQAAAPITAMRQLISSQIDKIDSVKYLRNAEIDKKSNLSSLSRRTRELSDSQFEKLKQPLLEKDQELEQQHKQLADMQRTQHMMFANCGKDKFDGGTDIPVWQRMIPAVAGTTAGLMQALRWAKEPVRQINTYAGSPYSSEALRTLASLRYNPYAAIKASKDAERRSSYELSQQGVTGGRRDFGRIALGIANQQNAANVISAAQQQNNSYAAQYANALLNEGNQIASRRQSANQFDRQDYVAAHGRKTKGIETATANILNQINSAYQNEFKYNTWRETADLYRQQLTEDQKRRIQELDERKAMTAGVPINTTYKTPTQQYSVYPQYSLDPFWTKPYLIKPNKGGIGK